ncbi:hypothetical protein AJ81_01135 [Pseudothermotoga hypogea DSM 11164 = NBRC 106472]|uniref:Uncharacterized protein n=1 Tax=Pseudothermotoga hypogea DSM 11164 = NBRC 106472 TaxID=1123384 RepID=A0A0X1KTJ4_9THEM|nr:hypothetical protein [Pseudothermotoga hypogea]AJC74628.1 hypothetical protein AJ81_01135 [Pseudothermotoga hypogea DSM 11164 = NBRC 106472]MBC7121823.1 hypothetical protein [Pseudothermotoga sp.]MDI6863258.1 hypothetical protein [Pseudothermotoga sp.]
MCHSGIKIGLILPKRDAIDYLVQKLKGFGELVPSDIASWFHDQIEHKGFNTEY